ncbi:MULTISPECIES: PHP domain-containing protein [Clostridium]|jgi:predicted metal-dependent phosphoesterase TrpH|uniref:PHP domain-containing protein n=1 Tax=Clostridium disporicum TaxID=84024 RepID=A0A174BGS4_9CLOT|nr:MULTISPECIES: PHP domain-containing protein [Clostridium]MCD2500757.1 PHP domain-containing protein [Clostridium sp. NSJ-145]MDU6340807.1 PHP domain-containing protein [Clostridium sp.]CUN98950.1 PHP domain-containing protein [Clostridium disporicum]
MKSVDLHIHSCYSDGIYTPEQIAKTAKEKGIKCISITDHDSIAAQYIVNTEYNNKDLKIIPGIELSTEYKEMELHILGYFIDIENNNLKCLVDNLNKQRLKRVEKILYNLKGYDINIQLDDLGVDLNSTIGRSHIANAMVKKGYFDNYKTAFKSYLIKGKPGYVKGFKLTYREALDIIMESGGVPVLAHPGQIYKKIEVENIIKELKCFGLSGVEVYHPSHSAIDTNKFFNMAKKYKLSITGGSDFHGRANFDEQSIGSCGINDILLNKFIKNR